MIERIILSLENQLISDFYGFQNGLILQMRDSGNVGIKQMNLPELLNTMKNTWFHVADTELAPAA